MSQQSIAIVGLGRVGSVFLEGLLDHARDGIKVVAVSEQGDTAGKGSSPNRRASRSNRWTRSSRGVTASTSFST